jgi:arsenate reductase
MIFENLQSNIERIQNLPFRPSVGQISEITKLVNWLVTSYKTGETPALNFICTHNSRRSHIGQFWGAVIPYWLGLPPIQSYSGGTEVTACHPNTLKALSDFGVEITALTEGTNPHYQLKFGEDIPTIEAWSKLYSDSANPQNNFAAIMTCTSADEGCPFVAGAIARISLPFTDPKHADGTPQQDETYLQTIQEIGQVMLCVFKQVKVLLAK